MAPKPAIKAAIYNSQHTYQIPKIYISINISSYMYVAYFSEHPTNGIFRVMIVCMYQRHEIPEHK